MWFLYSVYLFIYTHNYIYAVYYTICTITLYYIYTAHTNILYRYSFIHTHTMKMGKSSIVNYDFAKNIYIYIWPNI